MNNKLQMLSAVLACGLLSQAAQAVTLTYDQTVIITDSDRPITFASHGGTGINPFVFQFDGVPIPISSTINITVFGVGDFDGLEDPDIWGMGFQETLSASMDSIGLALDGDTKLGPFSGSREFSLSGDFGWSTFTFSNGLTGTIYLAQGVGQNLPTDYLGMRIQYLYDGVPTAVPVPAAGWLLGSGLTLLLGMARRGAGNTSA